MRDLSSHSSFGSHHGANHWAEPPLMRFNFRSVDDKKSFLRFYISISNELTTASNPVIPRILVEDNQKLYPSVGVTGVKRLLFELAAELINNITHGDGALQLAYLVKLEEHPSETDVQCIKSILQRNPLTFIVLSVPTLVLGHRVLFSSSDIIKSENCTSHAARLFVPSEPLIPSNDTSSSFENNIQGPPAELELVTPFQTLCRAYCLPTVWGKIKAIHVPMSLLHAAVLNPGPEVRAVLRLTMLHEMTHRVLEHILRWPGGPRIRSIPWINSGVFDDARMEAGFVTEVRLAKGLIELVSTRDGQLRLGRVVSSKTVHEDLVRQNPHLGELDPVILELLSAEEVRDYADGIFEFERESSNGPTYIWHSRTEALPEVDPKSTGLREPSVQPEPAPPQARVCSKLKFPLEGTGYVWVPRNALRWKTDVYRRDGSDGM